MQAFFYIFLLMLLLTACNDIRQIFKRIIFLYNMRSCNHFG